MEAREVKKQWRQLGARMFRLLPRSARLGLDALVANRVKDCVSSTSAQAVLGYWPLPDEPDVSPFLYHWLFAGHRLALPVWLGEERCVLRWVTNPDKELRQGRAGLLEPLETLPEADPKDIDLALVPGRFFSESCDRMGRGAGVYDTLLRDWGILAVGVAYDFQVVPEIPVSPADIPVDLVLTPSRVILRESDATPDTVRFRSEER